MSQNIDIDTLSKSERGILLYAETCLVDFGGLLEGRRMNNADIDALKKFQQAGVLEFGRIPLKTLGMLMKAGREPTYWVTFNDASWALAHALRRHRAAQGNSGNRKMVDAALAERAGLAVE